MVVAVRSQGGVPGAGPAAGGCKSLGQSRDAQALLDNRHSLRIA
jgi:hypothetical protein